MTEAKGTEIFSKGVSTDIWMYPTPSAASRFFAMPARQASSGGRTVSFSSMRDAQKACSTAYQLLGLKGVTQVTVGPHPSDSTRDYVTVSMADPAAWEDRTQMTNVWLKLKMQIDSGRPLLNVAALDAPASALMVSIMPFGARVASFRAVGHPMPTAEHMAVISVFNDASVSAHGGTAHYMGYDPVTQAVDIFFDGACRSCVSTDITRAGLLRAYKTAHDAGRISKPVRIVRLVTEKPKGANIQ